MKFTLLAFSFLGTALAAPSIAKPEPVLGLGLDKRQATADLMTIGFRTVDKTLADKYEARGGKLFYDTLANGKGGYDVQQLGPGVYLSPGAGDYRIDGNNDWICRVLANKAAWNEVPKLWIPGMQWWPATAQKIIDWVKSQGFPTWATRSARMSIVEADASSDPYSTYNAGKHQLVLPPLLANTMDFYTECWSIDTVPEQIFDFRRNFMAFQNVHGVRQYETNTGAVKRS